MKELKVTAVAAQSTITLREWESGTISALGSCCGAGKLGEHSFYQLSVNPRDVPKNTVALMKGYGEKLSVKSRFNPKVKKFAEHYFNAPNFALHGSLITYMESKNYAFLEFPATNMRNSNDGARVYMLIYLKDVV